MPWTANSGKTLKRPDEYSKNPNTIRARKRKAGLSEYQREVEQAKASDSKAITRAWKLCAETPAYKMAKAEERQVMLENVESEVMDRRRTKGYDAKSKIQNFLYRQGALENSTPTTTPMAAASASMNLNVSKVDPDLGQLTQTPPPSGYGMQPAAPMNLTPYRQQQYSFTASSQPLRPSPIGQFTYGTGSDDGFNDAATISRLQVDLAAEAMTKANLQVKLKENDEKVAELEKHIEHLTNDLVITKGSLRTQEERMQQIDERMRTYAGTAADMSGAESEFCNQAAKLRRVVSGVQKIAQVLGEVAKTLVDDYASSKSIDHAISTINVANKLGESIEDEYTNNINGANSSNGLYETNEENVSFD